MKHLNDLEHCMLCPRVCRVNRKLGQKGYCRESAELMIGRAALHYWEEPCISGTKGSGAVFFSGCNMGCVFCQNYNLSRAKEGKVVTVRRLAEIFLELEAQGAHNINLVTPTHYVVAIIEALELAKTRGLTRPIIYNCSGYERVETLEMLDGLVDIYLPDCKYYSEELAKKYSHAPLYFEVASKAIEEMVRQVGSPKFDEEGIMQKGVIVRHLMLPGKLMDSKAIVKYLYAQYKDTIYMSLMNQYTPLPHVIDYPELNRKVSRKSYERLIQYALDLGVENAFIQEGETATESFIPIFNGEGV